MASHRDSRSVRSTQPPVCSTQPPLLTDSLRPRFDRILGRTAAATWSESTRCEVLSGRFPFHCKRGTTQRHHTLGPENHAGTFCRSRRRKDIVSCNWPPISRLPTSGRTPTTFDLRPPRRRRHRQRADCGNHCKGAWRDCSTRGHSMTFLLHVESCIIRRASCRSSFI